MLRACSRVIALAAIVVSMAAQAADTTLTLAWQGTVTAGTEDAKPEPISMGIIVNFTNRTVQDLLLPASESVPISDVIDLAIAFDGGAVQGSIHGTIDRVTCDLLATFYWSNASSTDYALKCRPAQRMACATWRRSGCSSRIGTKTLTKSGPPCSSSRFSPRLRQERLACLSWAASSFAPKG